MSNARCNAISLNSYIRSYISSSPSLITSKDPKAVAAYLSKAGSSFDYFNDDMYISKSRRKPIERAPSVEEIYKV